MAANDIDEASDEVGSIPRLRWRNIGRVSQLGLAMCYCVTGAILLNKLLTLDTVSILETLPECLQRSRS